MKFRAQIKDIVSIPGLVHQFSTIGRCKMSSSHEMIQGYDFGASQAGCLRAP
jgi:hypothetical protein